MQIVGVDPGGTTGVAKWEIGSGIDSANTWEYVAAGTAPYELWEVCSRIVADVGLAPGDTLVCEDFVPYVDGHGRFGGGGGGGKAGVMPVGVLGAMGAVVAERCGVGGVRLVLQTASLAKATFNDARLREAGVWVKGKPHGRDAWRHVLTWAKRSRLF